MIFLFYNSLKRNRIEPFSIHISTKRIIDILYDVIIIYNFINTTPDTIRKFALFALL